jgi:hypothetical protein
MGVNYITSLGLGSKQGVTRSPYIVYQNMWMRLFAVSRHHLQWLRPVSAAASYLHEREFICWESHDTSIKTSLSVVCAALCQTIDVSPSQGLYLYTGQHYTEHNTDIHGLSGIRTHDPGARASEDSSYYDATPKSRIRWRSLLRKDLPKYAVYKMWSLLLNGYSTVLNC